MKRLLAALVVFSSVSGCKPDSARTSDHAAHRVLEERKNLQKAVTRPADVGKESAELREAEKLFIARRALRIDVLRGQHSVIASQTQIVGAMAQSFPLTDAGRAAVNSKLTAFQIQLDQTANLIEGLRKVGPDAWEARDAEVHDAMQRLEDARHAAWQSLEDAPRIRQNPS